MTAIVDVEQWKKNFHIIEKQLKEHSDSFILFIANDEEEATRCQKSVQVTSLPEASALADMIAEMLKRSPQLTAMVMERMIARSEE